MMILTFMSIYFSVKKEWYPNVLRLTSLISNTLDHYNCIINVGGQTPNRYNHSKTLKYTEAQERPILDRYKDTNSQGIPKYFV